MKNSVWVAISVSLVASVANAGVASQEAKKTSSVLKLDQKPSTQKFLPCYASGKKKKD